MEATRDTGTSTGDPKGFSSLVMEHRTAIFRFARRLTHDDALAEDVLQDTLMTAFRSLANWRGDGSVRGWLFAIARSKVLIAKRRHVGEPAQFEDTSTLAELGLEAGWGAAMSAEALMSRIEQEAILSKALFTLDEKEREVIALRDLEGLSGEETAQALGLSVPATKSRLHRARLRLVAAVKRGNDGQ